MISCNSILIITNLRISFPRALPQAIHPSKHSPDSDPTASSRVRECNTVPTREKNKNKFENNHVTRRHTMTRHTPHATDLTAPMDVDVLSFTVDWRDDAQEYTRTFTLKFYVDDGDIELVRMW